MRWRKLKMMIYQTRISNKENRFIIFCHTNEYKNKAYYISLSSTYIKYYKKIFSITIITMKSRRP